MAALLSGGRIAAQQAVGSEEPVISILGTGSNAFIGSMYVPNDSLSAEIPFSRAGNLIVIQARVDSTEGNFILDTGAPGLILNLTYFRHYPANEHSDASETQGGITGTITAQPTVVPEFNIGPFEYGKVPAHRINLGHIENNKGIRILGLLGTQLFARFEMIIDYERSIIYLHRIGKRESKTYRHAMLSNSNAYSELPMYIKDGKLLADARLGDKKLTFVVDTGAESNVLDSRLPDKIFDRVAIMRRVVLAGTGNSKVDALYGRLSDLSFGTRSFKDLTVVVTNMEQMCAAYDRCIDGMLGYDFLSMHMVAFNFVNQKMYIWK